MLKVMIGDVIAKLKELPDESVHCVVTSPPYWGLRDYSADGQIGLEPTPEAHIEKMVAVFREVRRVLRADGTCWVNYGDCFNDKQLVMMPARVALALQSDGWWLRSEIIWAKPNPMPESCTDRPTSAHEKIYLLAKSSRYFFDAEAVREKAEYPETKPRVQFSSRRALASNRKPSGNEAGKEYLRPTARNIRNVWSIPTAPFPGAHFATFPPEIPLRCIRAGTSLKGVCPECGGPWVREVESKPTESLQTGDGWKSGAIRHKGSRPGSFLNGESKTVGWRPSCECETGTKAKAIADPVPATVLDPFFGAGTTGLVAIREGRRAIGIELNPEYAEMAERRIRDECSLLIACGNAIDPPDAQGAEKHLIEDLAGGLGR